MVTLMWRMLPFFCFLSSIQLGCLQGDSGVNPPPSREANESPTPPPEAPGEQKVAVLHFSQELPRARVHTTWPSSERPLLAPDIRNYPNPWAIGRHASFRYRLAWTTGTKNQWDMRDALVFPTATTVEWVVQIPPHSELSFDFAAGSEDESKQPEVNVTLSILHAGNQQTVWTNKQAALSMKRLRHWTPARLDLSPYGNQSVRVRLEITGPSGSETYARALFAEMMLHTRSPRAAELLTGKVSADNVLLIVVDAQRADTISPLRQGRNLPRLFPTMEGLVEAGTVFTRARSVGNQTRLSTYAFLSGQYPKYGHFHNEGWDFEPEQKSRFYAHRPPLLAHRLRQHGYRSATFGNNAFIFGNLEIGLDAGYDRVTDHRNSNLDTPWMTDSAIQWMRAHSEERWFMVVNYNAPHSPYWPPDELWLPFKPLLENVDNFKWPYLGEIKYVDVHLQRLLDAVDALNLSERTLVIFTSDHGEIMDFRHRGWNETFRRRTYHSHGVTLYDEETRVPLVFRQNGRIPTGQRVDAPFSHVDLPPTILGLLGLPPEPGHLGRDFSNAVLGTGPSPPDAPIRSEARLSTSLVWQGLKYIVHDPSMKVEFALPTLYDPARGNEELYDLNVDPDELNNLAWESDSSRLESMRALLKQQDEELEQRQSHGPWTHLRFHGGLRQQQFTGSIHTEGTIARLELVGEPDQNRCTLDSEKTIHVDAQSGGGRGLRFVTEPPNAAVHLQLAIDSVVIQADRVFVGTYGLNLLQDPLRIDRPEQWALTAAGGGEPRITAESKSGVFLWRDQGFDSPNPVNSPDVMDESVRKMMQDWGYQ